MLKRRTLQYVVRGLFLVVLFGFLPGCSPDNPLRIEDTLTPETQAKLTPVMKRYVLLADIKTWTGAARKYTDRPFCPQPQGTPCADKAVVKALDETTKRLKPAVISLAASAGGDDLLTYIGLANALLLELQSELAGILVKE